MVSYTSSGQPPPPREGYLKILHAIKPMLGYATYLRRTGSATKKSRNRNPCSKRRESAPQRTNQRTRRKLGTNSSNSSKPLPKILFVLQEKNNLVANKGRKRVIPGIHVKCYPSIKYPYCMIYGQVSVLSVNPRLLIPK
jgi:hypothetical protein